MQKSVKIGDGVTFIDPLRNERAALVTHVWGPETYPDANGQFPALNLVFVSGNPAKQDQFGTQIEHVTSVCHQSLNSAGCNAWR